MRQLVIVVLMFLFVAGVAAEDAARPREAGRTVYFGAPVIKGTVLRDQGGP